LSEYEINVQRIYHEPIQAQMSEGDSQEMSVIFKVLFFFGLEINHNMELKA